jgi:pyridoxal/pyridoxine/pyridoxamine kinase
MTITSLVLINGVNLKKEALMISLSNAKQVVIGNAIEFGWILHVAASTPADLTKAVTSFSKIPGVKSVVILSLQNPS